MLCVCVHRSDSERVWNGSRLAPYQTLFIERPSSVFFWHMLFVIVPFFLLFLFSFFYLFSCFHWSFIGVPFIFFCSADHVPDWQPRILLGKVEARWIHVKNTTKTTTLDKQRKCFFASVCVFFDIVEHTLRLISSDKILLTWNCVMGKL